MYKRILIPRISSARGIQLIRNQ